MPELLVTPDWLADRLADVRVLDVRGEVASAEPRYRAHPERYREGHIPGAAFADWRRDFTDRGSPVPVTIAPPAEFAADATRLGIGPGSTVVAYDDYHGVLAGRMVWALRSYGHGRAHLLDGGLEAWRRAGGGLRSGDETPGPADPPFPVPAVLEGLVGIDEVQRAIGGGVQLVDARKPAEYSGDETHAARGGHIPGALNLHYRTLLRPDGTFLPPDELRRVLEARGIDLARPLIAYCNGGVSATHVAHAVQLAGAARPVIYDGSWNEWGNRDDTPVETGT